MYEIRIEVDRKHPELITVTALDIDTGFSYQEKALPSEINIGKFTSEALARKAKWLASKTATMTASNTLAAGIFSALNKGVQVTTLTDSNSVQCVKYVEPIKEEIKEI